MLKQWSADVENWMSLGTIHKLYWSFKNELLIYAYVQEIYSGGMKKNNLQPSTQNFLKIRQLYDFTFISLYLMKLRIIFISSLSKIM